MNENLMHEMRIKKLEPKDLGQFNDLLRYAFQVTDEELLRIGWENDDIQQSKFPILESANVIGWFEADRLAAQIAVYPMQMNVRNTIYDMGFVTGVATYPEYTGRGLMSALMKQALTEMRAAGQSVSLLYPYSIPFYRHKGWELISDKMTFHLTDRQLPRKIEVSGRVRRVDMNDPDVLTLHDRFARRTHGCIIRNELAWEEYWRWESDDIMVAVYYDESETPQGYMVYMLKNDEMHIKEIVHFNQEAWNGLWVYIAAHESMIDKLDGCNYSNTSLAFWLEDSDIKETIQPYMMARIVDFEQFISRYNFVPPDREESLTFEITDTLLEWNNGSFTLKFSPGSEKAELSAEPAANGIRLSIGTLCSMLMGYKRPAYLSKIERLVAGMYAIRLLEGIIPQDKAYISDYM